MAVGHRLQHEIEFFSCAAVCVEGPKPFKPIERGARLSELDVTNGDIELGIVRRMVASLGAIARSCKFEVAAGNGATIKAALNLGKVVPDGCDTQRITVAARAVAEALEYPARFVDTTEFSQNNPYLMPGLGDGESGRSLCSRFYRLFESVKRVVQIAGVLMCVAEVPERHIAETRAGGRADGDCGFGVVDSRGDRASSHHDRRAGAERDRFEIRSLQMTSDMKRLKCAG